MTSGRRTTRAKAFYEHALTEAEIPALAEARDVHGLTEEAALLRVRLREALERQPDDWDVLLSGVRLLVNVLLVQHRLSGQQAEDLTSSLAGVFEHFDGMMRGVDVAS